MTALKQLQTNYWPEQPRLQRWGHVAIPLSSTRVAIHGGYGRDGKKLRRLDDVVIVSSNGGITPTVSSTPRPKARERHGAAAVQGGFVIHGGRAGGAFGDAWHWDDDVWTELRCEGSAPAPRWSHGTGAPMLSLCSSVLWGMVRKRLYSPMMMAKARGRLTSKRCTTSLSSLTVSVNKQRATLLHVSMPWLLAVHGDRVL